MGGPGRDEGIAQESCCSEPQGSTRPREPPRLPSFWQAVAAFRATPMALRDACREERQGGMGGITSVVVTARRGVGVPARLPLGFSEKGLFGYRKGWLHLPLQLGRDISGLLSVEASLLEICAAHQRENTHREEAPCVPGLGALLRSPRQSRGPGYILLFFCPCSRMAGRQATATVPRAPCPWH